MGVLKSKRVPMDFDAISESQQWTVLQTFNATIELVNPHINEGAFDRATNTKTRQPDHVLWTGRARIQSARWPNVATTRQEAVAARTVVFHIPLSENINQRLIQEGYRIHVLDGGKSPEFTGGLFVVTSGVNSSYAWDRRIETMMDQGTVIT